MPEYVVVYEYENGLNRFVLERTEDGQYLAITKHAGYSTVVALTAAAVLDDLWDALDQERKR